MSNNSKIVFYDIGVDGVVEPSDPLPPVPEIAPGALVVLTGRAPIWRYGIAFHQLHGSPAGAVATFDPRLGGAVVVATHVKEYTEGQVVKTETQ